MLGRFADYFNYVFILIIFTIQFVPSQINTVEQNLSVFKHCQLDNLSCKIVKNHFSNIRIKRKVVKSISRKESRVDQCIADVTLKRCNTKFVDDPKWIWRRIQEYHIPSKVERKCDSSSLSYYWTIHDNITGKNLGHFPEFKDKSTFIVKYYGIDVGNFKLKLTVTEKAEGRKTGKAFAYCLIRMKAEDPIPIIRGGSKRTVPSGKEFTMMARDSINMDTPPGQLAFLNFQWFCSEGPQPLCNNEIINRVNEVIVPANEAIHGTTFKFSLKISTNYSKWFSTSQIVKVKENAQLVYINCLKNCGPKVNAQSVTYLEAKCEECPKEAYVWSMTPGQNNSKKTINFKTETEFGENSRKLVIKERVLKGGDLYTFNVVYDGGNSESSADVLVAPPPSKGNCKVTPSKGQSLTTVFTITCSNFTDTDTLTYRIFQRESEMKNQGVLLAANEDGQFELFLSAGKSNSVELLIKVSNSDSFYVEEKLTASVTSIIESIPPEQQIKNLLDVYDGKDTQHKSVKTLIVEGDTEGAIQMINALTAEARKVSKNVEGYEQFKKKLKALITADLEQLPWESLDALRQVVATIKNLSWEDKDKIDRDFAKAATRLCKKVAENQLKHIMESPNKKQMTEDSMEISSDLLWCADTNMKPNLTDLAHEDLVFNITTAYPLLTFPVIPENYPNYDDADLELAEKIRDYQEICENAMQTFELTGIGISETLATGEPVKQLDKYTNTLQILKDEAQELPEKVLGGFGSLVKASKGLAAWKAQPVVGVVTAFKDNPFWWDAGTKQLSGHVLHINHLVGTKKFANLLQLLFDVNETKSALINASVTVPTNLNNWIPEFLDYNMTVHRVDVTKGAGLRVEFFGLQGNDKIQVVLKYNNRPHYDDFKKPIFLWPGKTMLMSLFPKDMLAFGDAWVYIAVFPDQSMIKGSEKHDFTYNYSVAFISPFCVYRKTTLDKWSSDGCRTGKMTTLTKLHCFCKHNSAYLGVYLNAPNKIDSLIQVNIVISLAKCYAIFISVCIIFGIYCIALALVAFTRMFIKPTNQVYFLADNVQHDRYAYLVIIKTGDFRSAGTTSNIGIKVFGKKCNSSAHVINYPDPDKKLLQKGNEDWFILTTEGHLGNITKIYVWHDSIGVRPSWNCEWISIKDLQGKEEWFFDVKTWFSVLKEEIRYLSVEPSPRKMTPRSQTFLAYLLEEHNWNICKSLPENYLTCIQRITIMFSVVLLTYSLALVMYGTPRMRYYDGFSNGHYFISFITILIAVISSILSFLWNMVLIMLFRKCSREGRNSIHWVLLCITIVASLTFLIIFGFWVAHVTSLLWITSIIGALVQSAFLLENIYILIKFGIRKCRSTSNIYVASPDTTRIIQETEKQRYKFFSKYGFSNLRLYFVAKHRPLTKEQWKIKKEQEIARLKIAELLQDLVMFLTYIVILYMVALANKDSLNIYSNNEIKSIIHGEHTRTMSLEEIHNVNGFYDYIIETFIPNIHSMNWYGEYELQEPGLMADFTIKILGVARFRQLRICKSYYVPIQVRELTNFTLPEFSSTHTDVGEYMEYWRKKLYVAVPRLIDSWKYQNDAMSSIGELNIYPGGGYSAPLGRTLHNSYYNLKYFHDTKWIDDRSRVIHVEFLTYNANYNIFHAVKLIIEQSASGLFIKTYTICTTRLLFVNIEIEIMIFILFASFIVIIFIMFAKHIYLARKNWRTHFKEPWNIVDIAIILISFVCVGLYKHRDYLVGDFLQQLEAKKHNVFISYFHLIYMEQTLTIIASILICIATVRLWKLLRFGVVFKVMEKTLVLSARPLTAVGFTHLIIILMYTFSGNLLFGMESHDFRHITAALTTLILLSLNLYGDFDYNSLQSVIGYFYYISYMLISMTMITLYIAVIVLSYEESANYYSQLKEYFTVQKYVDKESKYYQELVGRRVKNIRLRSGGEELNNPIQKKATPKSDEHRYADSVVVPTHKLFVMSLIARCAVFKTQNRLTGKKQLSNAEADLMKRTAYYLTTKEDLPEMNSIAFKTFDEKKNIKLISNTRILKMEYVVNYILDEATIKNSKIDQFENVDKTDETVIKNSTTHERLDYFEDVLKSVLQVFNNINIKVPKDC